MTTLRNWSLRDGMCLRGDVYSHPNERRFPDGSHIDTSPIREVLGDQIITRSGTIYRLEGMPESGYAKYLDERPNKDPTNDLTKAMMRAIDRAKREGIV